MGISKEIWLAYKLRWKRRKLLFRAFQNRHQLALVVDRTKQIKPCSILVASTVRNEIIRLPYFLQHQHK